MDERGIGERYEYPFSNVMYALVIGLFAAIVALMTLSLFYYTPGSMDYSIMLGMVILFAALTIIFIPALGGRHYLYTDRIVITQGLLFNGSIPLANIASFGHAEKGPIGLGVKFDLRMRTIFVATSWSNLIQLDLKEPMGFGRTGMRKKVDKVVFNVNDMDGFLGQLEIYMKRMGSS